MPDGIDFSTALAPLPAPPDFTGAYGQLAASTQALTNVIKSIGDEQAKRSTQAAKLKLQGEIPKMLKGATTTRTITWADYHPVLGARVEAIKNDATSVPEGTDPQVYVRERVADWFEKEKGFEREAATDLAVTYLKPRQVTEVDEETIFRALRAAKLAGFSDKESEMMVEMVAGDAAVGDRDLQESVQKQILDFEGNLLRQKPPTPQDIWKVVAGKPQQEIAATPPGILDFPAGSLVDELTGTFGVSARELELPPDLGSLQFNPSQFDTAKGEFLDVPGVEAAFVDRLNEEIAPLLREPEVLQRLKTASKSKLDPTKSEQDRQLFFELMNYMGQQGGG
jgi:hypothetical protein